MAVAGNLAGCGGDDTASSQTGTSGAGGNSSTGSSGHGGVSTGGGGSGITADGSAGTSNDASNEGVALEAGCLVTQKSCGGACVSKTDPLFGCAETTCKSCNMTPTSVCSAPEAGVPNVLEGGIDAAAAITLACSGTCAAGYEDLDGNPANGCETKTPLLVQPAALQLWLRSDRDMTCTADAGTGDLTLWKDQSGKTHDAKTPTTMTVAATGVQCTAAASGIHGMPVAHFPRGGDYTKDDGTLSVDLSFLANSDYTIFVVERRTDLANEEWLLGSVAPVFPTCQTTSDNQKAFRFGYKSNTQLALGHLCGGDLLATVAGADISTKPVSLDIGTFSKAAAGGHVLESGAVKANDTLVAPLATGAILGGTIGRGYDTTSDTRFQGDVAEIVVYNAALSEADKADVKAYLKAHWAMP